MIHPCSRHRLPSANGERPGTLAVLSRRRFFKCSLRRKPHRLTRSRLCSGFTWEPTQRRGGEKSQGIYLLDLDLRSGKLGAPRSGRRSDRPVVPGHSSQR